MLQDKKTIQSQFSKLKVAVIHDSYLYEGGAERVLKSILQLFPQAKVYIPLLKKPYLQQLKKTHSVFTTVFNRIPLPEKYVSCLKPFIFFYWQLLNLNRYNLVISSSHSFSSKSVKTDRTTLHVAYIHTPPRYLYQEFSEMNWLKKPPFKWLAAPLFAYLRRKDFASAQEVDVLIANSKTTQKRIQQYYHRQSKVIYPSVILPKNSTVGRSGQKKYYLFHSRLVKQKGAELVIKTFCKLKKPLLIVGVGAQEKYLKKIAGKNITFLGFVPDKKLAEIYSEAKALVYAGIEEDFGIVPVEAMSYGVPVIGFSSGGIRETVIDQRTGLLFKDYSIKSLEQAIGDFEKTTFLEKDCLQQAQQFSEEKFNKEFSKMINTQLAKFTNSQDRRL